MALARQDDRPILFIDGLNIFMRNYMANPAMNNNGELAGGIVGTLSTISRLTREIKPKTIFVAWEKSGSSRRKEILPEYKGHRKEHKPNRFYDDMVPDTPENKAEQISIAVDLLKTVPVCQLYVPNSEADDVIGFLCRNRFSDQRKVIVTSDKDYYQLLDEKTKIYSPGRKTYVYEPDVLTEYDVTANNFCVAKAFCGDTSDNIPGVPRVGFKTLAKRFPVLGSEVITTIEDIIALNEEALTDKAKAKLKIHQNISSYADKIRRNWKLMYLDDFMLDEDQIKIIDRQVGNHKPTKNKFRFLKKRRKHELDSSLNANLFFDSFSYFPESF